MATRTSVARVPRSAWSADAETLTGRMEGMAGRRTPRYFSDGTGMVLSEEERAAEKVYIQKMEREKLEKIRRTSEEEKADAANTDAKGEKKPEEPQKS